MIRRNAELAVIQKLDPERLRIRTVETEKQKLSKSRARRKSQLLKEAPIE